MLKIQIFEVSEQLTKGDILKSVSENSYSESEGFGFDIIDSSEDNLEILFVEKKVNKQEFELVSGEIAEIESVTYFKFKFGIRFDSKIFLYVVNPPRSLKHAVDMIKLLFKGLTELKLLKFNLKELLRSFNETYNLKLESISISNIQYNATTLGKSKIISTENLYNYFAENYLIGSSELDSAQLNINNFYIEISKTGRFAIKDAHLSEFLLILDYCFAKDKSIFV